jgi:hypothetical protein
MPTHLVYSNGRLFDGTIPSQGSPQCVDCAALCERVAKLKAVKDTAQSVLEDMAPCSDEYTQNVAALREALDAVENE